MSETIGQKLKSSRQEKRLSIEQVAASTRVRSHYLEALERDELSAIPSAAQARGFLRIYADFLGLNADELAPVARPVEPQPIVTPPDTSAPLTTDLSAAPVQETVSTSAPSRPNLLTSLRDRFTRRSNIEEASVSAPSASDPIIEPEPEFVPARYTEELPAEPESLKVEKITTEEPTMPVKRSSGKKSTGDRKTTPRKPRTSSKAKSAKKTEVKKKITKNSRPKRGSSSRKLSSPQPHRALKKKSSRKSSKKRS